jgi:D-serine deaminase-like pyridoxal phosphate-dependent protein
LLIYPDRIRQNIAEMIRIAGSPERLVPHVKTHKMSRVVQLQLDAGIRRFKCATIAEAEMLAEAGATDVVVAYPLNPTKARRLLQLAARYPAVRFSSLVDSLEGARMIDELAAASGTRRDIYLDIDNGMHRTGLSAQEDIGAFYRQLDRFKHLHVRGFHVYDGHIHDRDFQERKTRTERDFAPLDEAVRSLEADGVPAPEIIAGGTPTFAIHALNPRVLCSPGTSLLWDAGYGEMLPEQSFVVAAVLLMRVISKPGRGRITTDLGHKSVAAENTIDKRIRILDLQDYEVVSQNEEHLVLHTGEKTWNALGPGDALYAVPYHICPTVALYDEAVVVEDGTATDTWNIEARGKRIHL